MAGALSPSASPSLVCGWYDVSRVRFEVHTSRPTRPMPRLAQLTGPSAVNSSVCDGYGVREFGEKVLRPGASQIPCSECPGNPYRRQVWSVLQCAAGRPLVPQFSRRWPSALRAPWAAEPVNVLLVVSDHNNHGLFAQVERVLNQLHLAQTLGFVPHIFLGLKVFNAPDACDIGDNQYFDAAHGDNVWEYYFEPVSAYRTGDERLAGRPVRLLSASLDDSRRYAITVSGDAVSSYFEFKRYDDHLHGIRTRVRKMGAQLVSKWIRVKSDLRKEAADLLEEVSLRPIARAGRQRQCAERISSRPCIRSQWQLAWV